MPTQREVAEAFFEGTDEPSSASNFRIIHLSEGGGHAILCGGEDGREVVLAEREPLNQYRYWRRAHFSISFAIGHLYNQIGAVRHGIRLADVDANDIGRHDDGYPNRTPHVHEYAPEATA